MFNIEDKVITLDHLHIYVVFWKKEKMKEQSLNLVLRVKNKTWICIE